MSGGGRTVLFGLLGVMISLATAFVLHHQHQRRVHERERTTESTSKRPAAPPSPPTKRRP